MIRSEENGDKTVYELVDEDLSGGEVVLARIELDSRLTYSSDINYALSQFLSDLEYLL